MTFFRMQGRSIWLGFWFMFAIFGSGAAWSAAAVRYVAIGDSYSIGEGASPDESWPALLARHLTKEGTPTQLVANPSRTGWTTDDAIARELPVAAEGRPDFATVQIGVNDYVEGSDAETFRRKFSKLLDEVLAILPRSKRLLVINIPNFSITPTGSAFGDPAESARAISSFNKVIAEEARQRQLPVVDVFQASGKMQRDATLLAADQLHPSAKEYAVWEGLIFPTARALLTSGNR